MNTQTVEEQVAAFDEVLLLTLFDIILQISQELLKQTDLLDPKTQALHRLFLSYLREYQRAKKSALHSPEGTESSPGRKTRNTGENKKTSDQKGQNPSQQEQNPPEAKSSREKKTAKKSQNAVPEREMLNRLKNTPSGLLMKPFDAPPDTFLSRLSDIVSRKVILEGRMKGFGKETDGQIKIAHPERK